MMEEITISGSELMAQLEAALQLDDIRQTYREFSRILRLAADQKSAFNALHLGSLFAKLDYLSREYHLERSVVRGVNDSRVRLRRMMALEDDELLRMKYHDLKGIANFISAVYQVPVPVALSTLFPTQSLQGPEGTLVAPYFRLYVTRWDDFFVYGTCEELPDEEVKVCYYYRGAFIEGDWRYLRELSGPNTQLNLIRPRLYEGVYYPELIILDPDYLIDITAIASCFEEYAHEPLLHLLSRLSPQDDTQATLLGNLAGQLLDEEVHSGTTPSDYHSSYAQFIRTNTFKALTTPIPGLEQEGEQQQRNIHHALHDGLRQRVGRYNPSEVMLEPSFFSEMLGLQGRMDFLQLDYKVLLEQKSGKGAYVPYARPTDPPRQQLKHYVQVLLYQAILNYNYQMPNQQVQTLLLYSKYAEGLIGVSPAPALLAEAIHMRNRIAALEHNCCEGGYSILEQLQPAQLCQSPQVNPRFWETYILPKFRKLLDPIHQATPLERAYFFRMLTFVANEHTLSKVGNKRKENSGFAAKWHDTLEEKYQAGNIYDQLTLLDPNTEHEGPVERLTFSFSAERASEMSNFRLGDIVIAYPYRVDAEPDARCTMIFRGNITDLQADRLTLQLRAPQSDRHVFLRHDPTVMSWAVEHDFMEASYRSQYAGIHAFLTAPKERRDLLLLQRQPECDTSLQLRGDYGKFNDLALRVKQARDLFLIIGPPGTGKTSYGMLYTLQEQLAEPDSQVLITSFTNRAVDEICSKLVEEGIDYIRIGSRHNCSAEYLPYTLDERLSTFHTLAEMEQCIRQTRVVVGTTASLSGSLALFRIKQFDLAIIDEASQILEPHLLALLSAQEHGVPAIRKFVMIGDHKQLPAVVQQSPEQSCVNDTQLRSIGLTDCRLSLFERLLHRYAQFPELVYMLTHQGRMHHDIADFPNHAFYAGKLHVVPLDHQLVQLPPRGSSSHGIDNLLTTRRICFVSVPTPEPILSDKVNLTEASMIAATAHRILRLTGPDFDAERTLGIIVPYRNQIAAIRNALDAFGPSPLHDITIDTVERYQGSQRDFILYGFTIQRPQQLNFLANNTFEEDDMLIDRKLNVAMTRARKHLFLFGNPLLLRRNPLFSQLLDYIQQRGHYLDVAPTDYIEGRF